MSLDSALQAALQAPVVNLFVAIEIQHPAGTIRLLDGAGVLVFGGHTWVGNDDAIGALGSVDVSADGTDDEAPALTIDIQPIGLEIGGAFAIPEAQGSTTSLYIGAFDKATGLVIGTPDLRFFGEVDTVTWNTPGAGSGDFVLRFEVVSGFERFFETDDGARLSDAFHQSIWPGEKGFQYMTSILDQMPWGVEGVRPALTVSTN